MAKRLNDAGLSHARSLIRDGNVNTESDWSFSADDGNALLGGEDGDDWTRYGRMHLATETEADEETKAYYGYPFGKLSGGEETVYRSGVIAIRQRAGQQDDTAIFEAAGELLDMIDEDENEDGDDDENRTAPRPEMTRKQVQAPYLSRQATVKPTTYDESRNTVDVVWSTGARVKRNSFFGLGEDFYEELSLKRSAVRLDRLNSGAPVLNSHNPFDLEAQIGVVESARIYKGEGVATVRLSNSESKKNIVDDIRDGIIRNISVGYNVHSIEELDPAEDGLRVFRASDWEPLELSFVTIGADSGASVRSEGGANRCNVLFRNEKDESNNKGDEPMTTEEKTTLMPESQGGQVNDPGIDVKRIAAEAVEAERKRSGEIRTAVKSVGLGTDLAEDMIARGVTVDEARKEILAKMSDADVANQTRQPAGIEIQTGEAETRREGLVEALLHRANPANYKLSDKGRFYRRMSLGEMARFCLEANGVKTWGMGRDEIVGRCFSMHLRGGLHSTSDFPEILANVINKTLRDSYEMTAQTFGPFVRAVTASDFKEISRVQLGDAPELEKLPEGGEIRYGTISESAEKYQLETYAKGLRISRKAIVNDDLDAFTRFPQKFGQRAAEKESDLVYAVLLNNAALSDGENLFSAAHSNLNQGSGAAALDEDTLSDMRTAMRKQLGLDGLRININPRYLLVPPELETTAGKLTRQVTPEQTANVNLFTFLEPVVEQRLSDTAFNSNASTTAHYLMGAAQQADMIELARLEGEEGPVIEREEMFDVEGMKVKARIDLAAKAIEYRAMQKNDGA